MDSHSVCREQHQRPGPCPKHSHRARLLKPIIPGAVDAQHTVAAWHERHDGRCRHAHYTHRLHSLRLGGCLRCGAHRPLYSQPAFVKKVPGHTAAVRSAKFAAMMYGHSHSFSCTYFAHDEAVQVVVKLLGYPVVLGCNTSIVGYRPAYSQQTCVCNQCHLKRQNSCQDGWRRLCFRR